MQNHLTQEERKLLTIFRQLNKDGRRTLTARTGEMLEIRKYTQESGEVVNFRPRRSE